MIYRICPDCGAHLDPGEICDCRGKENAAPDAANIEDGKAKYDGDSISQFRRTVK